MGLDPSTGDQDAIVVVGSGEQKLVDVIEHHDENGNLIHRDSVWIFEGDLFRSVTGPAVASSNARHLFFLRNDHLLSVDTEEAVLSEGPRIEDAQLLAFSDTDRSLFALTNCCPNRILEYDVGSGQVREAAVVGTGRNVLADVVEAYDEDGNLVHSDSVFMFEGDMFRVSFGMAAYDEPSNTVFLNRNRRVVSVAIQEGAEIVDSEISADLSIVGFSDAAAGVFVEDLPPDWAAKDAVPNPLGRGARYG